MAISMCFCLTLFFADPVLEALFCNPDQYVTLPAGTFTMGSKKAPDEQPQKTITLTRPFRLARFEVTQAQWQAVMKENPSHFKDPHRPVEMVTFADVARFLMELNRQLEREAFRLPTEAEWEYACRLGLPDQARDLEATAWSGANSLQQTRPVGTTRADKLGLYDMRGNVWEWVSDWYSASYQDQAEQDPTGPPSGKHHLLRGGDWESDPDQCRCGFRGNDEHGGKEPRNVYGFRLIWAENP